MKHDSRDVDGNFSVWGYTDRMAILVSIVLLALLRFLYASMSGNANYRWGWDKSQAIVWQAMDKKSEKKLDPINDNNIDKEAMDTVADKADPIDEWNREEIAAEDQKEIVPAWYTYLSSNWYVSDIVYADFDGDEIITRASSTPYLSRYAYISNLEEKSTVADCTFPDVATRSDILQKNIIAACGYDLLRGSNGNFIPDRNMTKEELLTVLVRTKAGYLDETTDPRFQNYFNYGMENGLLDGDTKISDFSWTVTKKELWQRLYEISLVK